jgi:hypothetical protein
MTARKLFRFLSPSAFHPASGAARLQAFAYAIAITYLMYLAGGIA